LIIEGLNVTKKIFECCTQDLQPSPEQLSGTSYIDSYKMLPLLIWILYFSKSSSVISSVSFLMMEQSTHI